MTALWPSRDAIKTAISSRSLSIEDEAALPGILADVCIDVLQRGTLEAAIGRSLNSISLDPIEDEAALSDVLTNICIDALQGRVGDATGLASTPPAKPIVALEGRERWRQRSGRFEKPLEFIERVYPDRREHGLTRGDFQRLDFDLYQALAQWLKRPKHEIPPDFGLPSKSDINDALLDALQAGNSLPRGVGDDPVRLIERLSSAARRRAVKSASAPKTQTRHRNM